MTRCTNLCLLLLAMALSVGACLGADSATGTNDFDVAGLVIRVPIPAGFARVPASPDRLNTAFIRAFPPNTGHRRLVSFVPQSALPLQPERFSALARLIHLDLSEEVGPDSVSTADFEEYAKKAQAVVGSKNHQGEPGDSSAAAPRSLESPVTSSFKPEVVSFPVHDSSPRHFAFSHLYRFEPKGNSGRAFGSSATVAHLLVGGKILVASVVGEPGDLAWTRTVCKDWTAALLQANPAERPDLTTAKTLRALTPEQSQEKKRARGELVLPAPSTEPAPR